MDDFLVDPNSKVVRFPLAKARRGHLHSRLGGSGCTHETEHRGSPHTLVVTKTQKAWEESHRAWEERCKVARQNLNVMDTPVLKKLLGDRYEELTGPNFCSTRKPAAGSANSPSQSSAVTFDQEQGAHCNSGDRMPLGMISQSRVKPTTPEAGYSAKSASKVEIIDLCSD